MTRFQRWLRKEINPYVGIILTVVGFLIAVWVDVPW